MASHKDRAVSNVMGPRQILSIHAVMSTSTTKCESPNPRLSHVTPCPRPRSWTGLNQLRKGFTAWQPKCEPWLARGFCRNCLGAGSLAFNRQCAMSAKCAAQLEQRSSDWSLCGPFMVRHDNQFGDTYAQHMNSKAWRPVN